MKTLAFALLVPAFLLAGRGDGLTDDEKKLLQDPGGWEYVTLSDAQNGFPTEHTCFDGTPHEEECSGRLTLSPAMTFAQVTRIKGQNVERSGRYELNGDQLAFFDELGTKDGPYTLTLDAQAKTLKLAMPQVTIEMLLAKEYRQRMRGGNKK